MNAEMAAAPIERAGGRKALADAVRALLQRSGRSAADVSEISGINATRMAALMNGALDLRLPLLADLAAALGVRTSYLAVAYALPRGAALPAPEPRRVEGRFEPREAAGRLGRAIRLARLLRGFGRRGIAAEYAVDQDELRRIEGGVSISPRLADLHQLAVAITDAPAEAAQLLGALVALYADDEQAERRVVALAPDLRTERA